MPNEGALFLGLAKGMQRGQERQQDLEHRKELLKLEQDKLKLMERETELTGQSKLYDTLIRMQQPTSVPKGYVQGGQFHQTDIPGAEGFTLGEDQVRFGPTAEPGVFGEVARGPSGATRNRQPSADIQMVDRLIAAGVPERQALDSVMRRDREGLIRLLLATAIRTPQLPGMPGPDIQGLLKQYDQLISGKEDPMDQLFKGLPPLPGSIQNEVQ